MVVVVFVKDIMWDCVVFEFYVDYVFVSVGCVFFDGVGNFVGFVVVDVDVVFLVVDNGECREVEVMIVFNDFGVMIDEDDFFNYLWVVGWGFGLIVIMVWVVMVEVVVMRIVVVVMVLFIVIVFVGSWCGCRSGRWGWD